MSDLGTVGNEMALLDFVGESPLSLSLSLSQTKVDAIYKRRNHYKISKHYQKQQSVEEDINLFNTTISQIERSRVLHLILFLIQLGTSKGSLCRYV